MNDIFAYKELSITSEQLDNLEIVEVSPIAKEVLQTSSLKDVKDLASPDRQRAASAARTLAREYFLIE